MGKKLLEATVKETKKCRHPSKFYVYVLEVTWSEGTSTIVYRRYSDFFEFQCGLLEKFPVEAGSKDPADRIIPFLPGKKLLGRSQVRSVAEKRRDKLNDYCQALVRLPPKISDDEFVHNFFELRMEDLQDPSKARKERTVRSAVGEVEEISGPMVLERYVAVADYEKLKKNECSLTAGQMVEVIDKNQNGWWFVSLDNFSEGWVPATYLEPLYGTEEAQVEVFSPGQEQYVTSSGYHAQNPDELSFEKGVIVDVIAKGLDGWWKIQYKGREGLAPAAYLNRYHGPQSAGANPAELVTSVRDAVQQASGPGGSGAEPRPKHSWQPSVHIDKEPIYAPTPRKMSVKRQVKRRAPPPPTPKATTASSLPSSPTGPVDEPCPVYEVIPEPEEEIYVTIADFLSSSAGDGLSFSAGSLVTLVTKNSSGWWYVEMGDKEGWVPSSYLERKTKSPVPPVASVVPAPQPVKSSPVHRRQLPHSTKNASLRRSTSEETLASKAAATKPAAPLNKKNSPSDKRPWLSSSASHQQLSTPTIAITHSPKVKVASHKERSLHAGVKKTPVSRSSSSDEHARHHHKPSPRTQNSLTNLNTPTPHVRTHSDLSKERPAKLAPRDRLGTSQRAESKPVTEELTRMLQKQTASPPHDQATPRTISKAVSPSTTRRIDMTKKQPEKPKPYTTSAKRPDQSKPSTASPTARRPNQLKPSTASPAAKRAPPKRPEPPKASSVAAAKKTAPPRPSTSPGQSRKLSAYTVACEYEGGDGQVALRIGQSVEVLEKNNDGWWYVKVAGKEGWAPSSYLENKAKPVRPSNSPSRPQPAQPVVEPTKPTPAPRPVPKPRTHTQAAPTSDTYRAAASYLVPAYEDSGIDLVVGKTYKVLEKSGGWWFVTDGHKDGWAPSSFLDPV